MGIYVESNLLKDEKIMYQAEISKMAMIPFLIIGGIPILVYFVSNEILLMPLLIAGLIVWANALIFLLTTEATITTKRIIGKWGLISRKTIELNISKIESVQINQGIFGRIFNYGSVTISGAGNPQAPIKFISNPLIFKKKFFEIQETESDIEK